MEWESWVREAKFLSFTMFLILIIFSLVLYEDDIGRKRYSCYRRKKIRDSFSKKREKNYKEKKHLRTRKQKKKIREIQVCRLSMNSISKYTL